jgi:hypothetical protein
MIRLLNSKVSPLSLSLSLILRVCPAVLCTTVRRYFWMMTRWDQKVASRTDLSKGSDVRCAWPYPEWSKRIVRGTPTAPYVSCFISEDRSFIHSQPQRHTAASTALFRSQISPQIPLCKKKIPHHIKMPAHVWSTKCRWNQKLITQFSCTLWDESFESN